jgi:hypothetical protein
MEYMITGLIAAGSYRIRCQEKRGERDECAPVTMLVFAGGANTLDFIIAGYKIQCYKKA